MHFAVNEDIVGSSPTRAVIYNNGLVAQLVEHMVEAHSVVGSRPTESIKGSLV